MSGIVVSIPHAATILPPEVQAQFRSHVDARFLLSESDVFTDQIYGIPGVRSLRYKWHRFLVDPNRAAKQESEGGVVPRLDFQLEPLYPDGGEPDETERNRRVKRYHQPFHEAVAREVADPETHFFIDAHSMAGEAPARAPDFGVPRPDAVLSNRGDEEGNPSPGKPFLTCPPRLVRFARDRLQHWLLALPAPQTGRGPAIQGTCLLNNPFKGGYGVRRHASLEAGVPGVQLELNQRMWCDETTWEPIPGRIPWIREVFSRWTADIETYRREELAQAEAQPKIRSTTLQ